ncbi:hypothetical protein P2D89_20365 [Agrobacterium rhizogenes]|uniref:hypothetical protein n=1 Tax=Rhizobium rhizogenes TaxID=359 RepID=UPI00285940A9|nr:hypothetical protein [Rhizobium rhizogenes]MDF1891353.1 hypothetical protein [Rhizobium rhizogenes]
MTLKVIKRMAGRKKKNSRKIKSGNMSMPGENSRRSMAFQPEIPRRGGAWGFMIAISDIYTPVALNTARGIALSRTTGSSKPYD